jgi:tyrosine-protein kinase Etk/Wzc
VSDERNELPLPEVLRQLAARIRTGRRAITVTAIAAALASTAVMLVVPESYRARATLLPPRGESSLGLAAAVLSQAGLDQLPVFGGQGAGSSDIFIEILRSRTVADRIIESIGLLKAYHLENRPRELAMESARMALRKRVISRSAFTGVITVDAEHRTGLFPRFRPAERERARKMAADIANSFCSELDATNREQASARARASREYYERQLVTTRVSRQEAIHKLAEFRRSTGAVPIEAEMQLSLQAAGEMKSQLLAKKIELGLVLHTDTQMSPRARTLRGQIDEIERQLRGIETGLWMNADTGSGTADSGNDGALVAYEYGRLLREAKTQEALEDILTQQFYDAQMQENRDLPTVEVLDRAIPPARKQAPVRSRVVLGATLLAAVAAAGVVMVRPEAGPPRT